jgi:hypothetical protein
LSNCGAPKGRGLGRAKMLGVAVWADIGAAANVQDMPARRIATVFMPSELRKGDALPAEKTACKQSVAFTRAV